MPSDEVVPTEAQKAVATSILLKLGQIVGALMRSPQFSAMSLSQLQALVMPPLLCGQYLVAETTSISQGVAVPVAAALWANVSADVDQRLSDLSNPLQLAPNEWKSGDIPWLIILAGDAKMAAPMINNLQRSVLMGQPLKMRIPDQSGNLVVATFKG